MGESVEFSVGEGEGGRRLDECLAGRLAGLSRMRIARLLAGGACAVNGAAAHAGRRVRAGDRVEVALADDAPGAMTPERLPVEVVFEDEHLLVVVKPAGMLVHPTRGVKRGTLANALAYHLNRFSISDPGFAIGGEGEAVGDGREGSDSGAADQKSKIENQRSVVRPGFAHRLDRATSGLMVVAKTQTALSTLARHFNRRLVEKRYLALLCGLVPADELSISAPVGRAGQERPHWRVSEGGKPAETRLRVVGRSRGLTLAELEPVTGRTNQLRIHCAHAGHPILGDEWYGGRPAPRLCLHAARLAFNHPAGRDRVEFASPLPDEMAGLFQSADEL